MPTKSCSGFGKTSSRRVRSLAGIVSCQTLGVVGAVVLAGRPLGQKHVPQVHLSPPARGLGLICVRLPDDVCLHVHV